MKFGRKRAVQELHEPGPFLRFANWVSEAMGRPTNIMFWVFCVMAWTFVFAFGGPHLASGSWLPRWFTSQGYNFPLNLITTVAELFIGFLVAAATNRAQAALSDMLHHIRDALDRLADLDAKTEALMEENTTLTQRVHDLTVEVHQAVTGKTA